MHVFRFQQLAINCTFAKREKCKQHYRILREVDINIIITKNDNIDGAGNLPKLYLLNRTTLIFYLEFYIFSKMSMKGYELFEMSVFRFLNITCKFNFLSVFSLYVKQNNVITQILTFFS